MSNFPDWVKVSYFDIDQRYDLDEFPQLGLSYQEWDDMKHGDLNKIAEYTGFSDEPVSTKTGVGLDDQDEFSRSGSGVEVYLTFFKSKMFPAYKTVPDMPNIGLVFRDGVYAGHGLGDSGHGEDQFSAIIQKHFDPYRGRSGDFDAILDAALKEVYDTLSVQGIANDLDE